MRQLIALLKQKPFVELTEKERAMVLKTTTVEDYEAERQMVILSDKLKQKQAEITPNQAIKAQLMAKMNAKTAIDFKPKNNQKIYYRLAASVLLCIGFIYLFKYKNAQNKVEKTAIVSIKKDTINAINLNNNLPVNKGIKPIIALKNKQIISKPTPSVKTENLSDEAALALSFNRKNPNLTWQTEAEEVDISEKTPLQCTSKEIKN
jgi:hypothetical protein